VTLLDPLDDVDEEFLENMVTYGKSVTGIDNVIFISPAHGQHGPRIKVAIDPPLPARPKLWVAGGGRTRTSLSPDPETIAPTVLERICRKADGWLARASGSNETVIADWRTITRRLDEIGRARDSLVFGHLNFVHVVPTDDEAAAFREQRPVFEKVMGGHRSFEHLANSYFLGTPGYMRERIEELAATGLQYLVLAPVVYDIGQLDLIESEVLRHFRTR